MVDYSKWKRIEISDDEDETHPNIDTQSLFSWKHETRVLRMEKARKAKNELEKAKEANQNKIRELNEKLARGSGEGENTPALRVLLNKLEETSETLQKTEDELQAREKSTPWNVDTISQPGFTKTLINAPPPKKSGQLTEEEREERLQDFINQNESILKQYGMLRRYNDSQNFLHDHPQIVCEDTASYLVIWCINLELQDKPMLAEHVAHQCICMQYILELAKKLDVDPRACVDTFFSKIKVCDEYYKTSFENELSSFMERVRVSANEKLELALKELEEEDRQARLGPGGLDPVEVFQSLPDTMKVCFEKLDVDLLQTTISGMPRKEASYHMNRCVDAGLWLPGGGRRSKEKSKQTASEENNNSAS